MSPVYTFSLDVEIVADSKEKAWKDRERIAEAVFDGHSVNAVCATDLREGELSDPD